MGIYGTLPIVVMLKTVYVAFDALQLSGAQTFIGEMLTHIEGVQQISDIETAYPKENEVWQVFVDRLGIALKLRHGRAEEARR